MQSLRLHQCLAFAASAAFSVWLVGCASLEVDLDESEQAGQKVSIPEVRKQARRDSFKIPKSVAPARKPADYSQQDLFLASANDRMRLRCAKTRVKNHH